MKYRIDMKAHDRLLGDVWLTVGYTATEREAGEWIAELDDRNDYRIVNVEGR